MTMDEIEHLRKWLDSGNRPRFHDGAMGGALTYHSQDPHYRNRYVISEAGMAVVTLARELGHRRAAICLAQCL